FGCARRLRWLVAGSFTFGLSCGELSMLTSAGGKFELNERVAQDEVDDAEHDRDHDNGDDYDEGHGPKLAPARPDDLAELVEDVIEAAQQPAPRGCRTRDWCSLQLARPRVCRERLSDGTYTPNPARAIPGWQRWSDSNARPAVLETAALPAELHPCVRPHMYK